MTTPRPYSFVSQWRIAAPLATVDATLLNYAAWTTWWRGLKKVDAIPHAKAVGSQFACTWQSALGYKLHITLTITEYKPRQLVTFTSHGDLEGEGRFELRSQGSQTIITIFWDVATNKAWMNHSAPLLKPLFIYNHRLLMQQGERGLNAFLQESLTNTE